MIDNKNLQFKFLVDVLENTNESVAISGKAGSGKTTLINHWTDITNKTYIKVAPTGLAALLIGGMTINSLCHIPWSVILPDDSRLESPEIYRFFKLPPWKKDTLRNVDVIIMDECSMIPPYHLDILLALLNAYRTTNPLPQFIFSFDCYQLAPVIKNKDLKSLKKHYKTNYFFSSNLYRSVKPHLVELVKVYRQKNKKFIELLSRVRMGNPTKKDIKRLNRRYEPDFVDVDNDYVVGYTHKYQVAKRNEEIYSGIKGEEFISIGIEQGKLPKEKPAPQELKLKIGCKVKMCVNDEQKRFVNGTVGVVTGFRESTVLVKCGGIIHSIAKNVWENKVYKVKKGKETQEDVVGTYTQYPIKLYWATTIHSMQGATIDKLAIDLSGTFAYSQGYVGLSRVTSLEGLVLLEPVHSDCFTVDKKLNKFKKKEVTKKQMEKYFKKNYGKKWKKLLEARETEQVSSMAKIKKVYETRVGKGTPDGSSLGTHKKVPETFVDEFGEEQLTLAGKIALMKENERLDKIF